jgi:hypothetical protein
MVDFVASTQAGARQVAPDDLNAAFGATLQKAGGTMTGALVLWADPTAPLQAATKQYVDAKAAGGTVTPAAGGVDTAAVNAAIKSAISALNLASAVFHPDPAAIDPTGNTDSTAGLQASIAAAAAAGGGIVVWPAGKFKVTATITNTTSGVRIVGAGHGAFHDTAPFVQAQTLLIWAGASGGTMLAVGPTASPAAQKLTGVDVVGIALQASSDLVAHGADYGLIATSVQHSEFDLFTAEFGIAAVAFTAVASAIGEAANSEGNTCSLRFRQENQPGTALQLGGSNVGNTCFNEFPIVYGYINNGIGIDFQNCDNNRVGRAWIDRVAGGTGTNLYFRSDAQFGAGGRCARVNTVFDFSQSVHSGSIYAEGTERGGALTASYGNRIERFDNANALPTFVLGTGASFYYCYNTSPMGMRESAVGTFDGHYQLANGVIEFWGSTGNLGAGTTSTLTTPFATQRILDVSAQVAGIQNAPGSPSCYNYSGRSDGAVNKFDLYSPSGGFHTFRGKALAPQ